MAAIHRKVRNQRRDLHHKTALTLVRRYDLICHEALTPAAMSHSARGTIDQPGSNVRQKAGLNRSILDAGWGQFLTILADKAACAGRQLIVVDPRHTSVTCARCGHLDRASRVSQAVFCCTGCGHQAHADINAACNVLRLGLSRRRLA